MSTAQPYFVARHVPPGSGAALMLGAYELRYNVYCIERRFLNANDYPDGCESDAFDDDAAHFVAHNLSGELVGYVRLVPPDANDELPFEHHCAPLPGHVRPPRDQCSEISRLMVRQDYRRRRGDSLAGSPGFDSGLEASPWLERRSHSPRILLTLYRQMYHYSLEHGIRYWYAAMERSLARSLQRLDFGFRRVGDEADYFGPVSAYLADLRELEARLARVQPDLLDWMRTRDAHSA